MKILITGGKGMLGRTLQKAFAAEELFIADLPEADITSPASLAAAYAAFKPALTVHCAAMTKVDDCETKRDLAYRLNRDGSANVARACAASGSRLIAVSTDYVFRGDSPVPYKETDIPAPRTVYGASKFAGEQEVFKALPTATVLRIAWLYGAGGPSFVHTMAKLGAQPGAPLKVVDDQRGNPTSTDAVAGVIRFLADHPTPGVVHGTCSGVCSWYDFAAELFRLLGLKRSLVPCTTAEFPRPAPRPANSALEKNVLTKLGYATPDWHAALKEFVAHEFSRS